jgi:hypothetical protein
MFSLRYGSPHVTMLNCIYKIMERKVKFNVLFCGGPRRPLI